LALDSIDRKIYSYLDNEEASAILKNNYLKHQYSKITVVETAEEVFEHEANVLIVNLDASDLSLIKGKIKDDIRILILLKSGNIDSIENLVKNHFSIENQGENFKIFKRIMQ
jgi:hypothetical protein